MAAPGYLVFPGKAFHCDILLNIGVHFKVGRIQFLELFRVIPPEQRKSYDAAALPMGSLWPGGASACFLFCSEALTCQASKQEG